MNTTTKKTKEYRKTFNSYWSANPFKMYSHIEKLYDWHRGKDIYPISIEIGLTSRCNHSCCWCSIDSKNVDRHHFLSPEVLSKFICNIKEMNVRSVVVSGSGEQTLHRHFGPFIEELNANNIRIGVNTNGSNLKEETCRQLVKNGTWLRVSLDAATEATRKQVHGVADLKNTVEGMRRVVELKKQEQSPLCFGAQLVVCYENCHEIEEIALLAKDIGVDYLQIKPVKFFEHYPERDNMHQEMADWLKTVDRVSKEVSDSHFQITVRYDQFLEQIEDVVTKRTQAAFPCLTSFSPYIEADGSVWYCVDKKGFEAFHLGNLQKSDLKSLWHSERRKEILQHLKEHPCTRICRNSPLNEFLWDMKNPTPFYDFL